MGAERRMAKIVMVILAVAFVFFLARSLVGCSDADDVGACYCQFMPGLRHCPWRDEPVPVEDEGLIVIRSEDSGPLRASGPGRATPARSS